jgi:hypothetical protein
MRRVFPTAFEKDIAGEFFFTEHIKFRGVRVALTSGRVGVWSYYRHICSCVQKKEERVKAFSVGNSTSQKNTPVVSSPDISASAKVVLLGAPRSGKT